MVKRHMAAATPHTLYMAPMLGITDSAYRSGFTEHFGGFDCAITPFIKTQQGAPVDVKKLADLLPARNRHLAITPQILSNSADDFIAVAKALFDLGYARININFGCPVPMAAGRGRGAGLLPYPDFVDRLLDRILTAIPNELSIKTRVGFDRPDQLLAMTPVFNRYPVREVAIHPRTAKQGYGGGVDHTAFAEAASRLRASVVYSGDINSLADFKKLAARYPPIRKWMLGRGAIANPLLAAAIQQYLGQPLGRVGQWTSRSGDGTFDLNTLGPFYRQLIYQYEQRLFETNVILSRLKTYFYYHAAYLQCEKDVVRKARKASSFDELLALLHEPARAIAAPCAMC